MKINWRDAWEEMRKERMRKPKISYDYDFFKKSAEDFSERIKLNDYGYGRKATEILRLNGALSGNFEVLEIGTEPHMKDFNVKLRIEYFFLGLRDKFGIPLKPKKELNKLGLKEGQRILDYGCGPGSYTFPAATLVGEKGRVFALDKQPLAIKRIKERARKEGFHNINTILSDGDTGLPDESVDVILLYGVLPEIENRKSLLKELYRVLKPDGYLSTRFCFRMKKDKILETVKGSKLFSLRGQKGCILNFSRTLSPSKEA